MSSPPLLLRMTNVEKRYGRRKAVAVEEFTLCMGDHVLLVGGNGSGKSTFLRIIAGVTPISRGVMHRSLELAKLVVGYVPQSGGIYADMTLRQNLAIFSRMYATQPTRRAEDLWLVRDTSLSSFIDVPVSEMSGGIQQLATFACVLSGGPHALLLDEPTSELDPTHAQQMFHYLELLRGALAFLIVSSHESHEAGFLSRKIVMTNGRITE